MCGDNICGDSRNGPEKITRRCVLFLVFNGANPPMANVDACRTRYRSSFLLVPLLLPALFLPDVTGFRVDNAESDAQLRSVVRRHDQHLSPDIKWIINPRNLFQPLKNTFEVGILILPGRKEWANKTCEIR